MKQIEVEVLDIKANYQVPATFDEARLMAPVKPDGTDVLLDRVVNHTLYHQVFGDLRSGLVDWIEKQDVAKRNRKTERNAAGKEVIVVDEKDSTFIKRVLAEGAVTVDDLAEQLQEMCNNAEYAFAEYLKSERRHAGPKTLPKAIQAAVQAAIDSGKAEEVAGKLSDILGRPVDATDPQSLGEALREHQKRLLDEAAAKAKAAVGL